jgi:hypothetical protein
MTTKKKRELRRLDLIFCDVKRFSQLMIPQGPHNEKKKKTTSPSNISGHREQFSNLKKKKRVVKRSKNRITNTQTRRRDFRFPFVLSIVLDILQNYRVIQNGFNCTIFNTRFRTQKATLDQLRKEYVLINVN